MAHTPEAILKALKAGQYAPVYFLHGEEPYYIDQITTWIEQNALAPHERSFNQLVAYGKDIDMATILGNARRFPMMAERQVVIVKEAQEVADLSREDSIKMFEAYLQKPSPFTVLVFAHKHKQLDGRKSLAKMLDKYALLIESKKVADYKLADWVNGYMRERAIKISPQAVQMLTDNIGNDLSRLANEIDKLLINAQGKGEITPDLVQQFVGISKEFNIFELQKALATRNAYKANQIINYFDANPKNNPLIQNVMVLFNYFTKLLLIHCTENKSEANLASILKLPPFVVKEYLAAVRTFPMPKVIAIIHDIREADLKAKGVESGNMTEGEILKELVFKILH